MVKTVVLIGMLLVSAKAGQFKLDPQVGESWEYHVSDTDWAGYGTESFMKRIFLKSIDSSTTAKYHFIVSDSGKKLNGNVDTTYTMDCTMVDQQGCTDSINAGLSYEFRQIFADVIYRDNEDSGIVYIYPRIDTIVGDSTITGYYASSEFPTPYGISIGKIYVVKGVGIVSKYTNSASRFGPHKLRLELLSHNDKPYPTDIAVSKIDLLIGKPNTIYSRNDKWSKDKGAKNKNRASLERNSVSFITPGGGEVINTIGQVQ